MRPEIKVKNKANLKDQILKVLSDRNEPLSVYEMEDIAEAEVIYVLCEELMKDELVVFRPVLVVGEGTDYRATITVQGRVFLKGGGYATQDSPLQSRKKFRIDYLLKIIAVVEGLVIIVITPMAFYWQVEKKEQETRIELLVSDTLRITKQVDSLKALLHAATSEVQRKDSIDSARRPLNQAAEEGSKSGKVGPKK